MNEEVFSKVISYVYERLCLRISHLEQLIPDSLQQYKGVLLSIEIMVSVNSSLPSFEVSDAA
ncbi:hypothetical protein [Nostoc sp. FACHB-892]|uniref:hypothetical protein n=1 Tax=Nostoc sp. FACHB-892 TaxID=2692843 RepID=UPI0016822678|nr:hypothetical protein [Nostoc sp. FACHB-892]